MPLGRSDPSLSSRGARAPGLHYEEQRRKEQELTYQRRELEAEKARLNMQMRLEDDLRRKASELERHRLEIEREKRELAKMKSDLLRERFDPYSRQPQAPPRSAPPRYANEAPRYQEGVRSSRATAPPPRYSEIRPPAPRLPAALPQRGPPRAAPLAPWLCSQCGTENRTNKFRCQTCSLPHPAEGAPPPVEMAPRGRDRPAGPPAALKPCKFGEGCRRPECRFGHPEMMPAGRKPCRYGAECKNPKCTFAHLVLVARGGGQGPPPPVMPGRPPRSSIRFIPTQRPPVTEELHFPDTLSAELVEKVKELFREGVNVGQQNLELLGQLGVAEAMDCLDVALRDGDAAEDPADRLKTLIEMQLTSGGAPYSAAADGEPAAKRAKVE